MASDGHRDTSLRTASLHQLVEELARRLNSQHHTDDPPEQWCDDCRHFRTNANPSPTYNPCAKRHQMLFYMPQEWDSPETFGYFRPICGDREPIPPDPPPPPAPKPPPRPWPPRATTGKGKTTTSAK